MALLASLRSTIAYQTTGSTISTGAIYQTVSGGAPVWSNALVSSMVSIGTSTNQVYTTLSQGNIVSSVSTSSWVSSLTNRLSTTTVAMSANAQYQLALSQSSISTSVLYTSTLGSSWSTLSGVTGLPNYSTISYTAGAISGDGRYGVLGTSAGQLLVTSTFGQSFTGLNTYSPAIYLPLDTVPTNGSSSSGTAPVTLTVVGPPTPAPSYVVGTGAVRFANSTTGGNATQYIRGTWTVPSSFSVSLWFNVQSTSTNQQFIFSSGTANNTNATILYARLNAGELVLQVPGIVAMATSYTITLNTWYSVFFIIQSNGACSLYVNNILIGTITSTATALSSGNFGLGTYDAGGSLSNAFSGLLDDVKIYNAAIPFTPMYPSQSFTSTAVSNSGQYMLASMANQGLYMSSNFGSSWSQVTGALLTALWSSVQVSATGQYMLAYAAPVIVQPQLAGLTAATWQSNGITWTAIASSIFDNNYPVSNVFNNNKNDEWVCAPSTYSIASPGIYSGTVSTNVIGQSAVPGEYVQIQSSSQLQIISYSIAPGSYLRFPNTYTIAGSNDGTTWYLIQSVTMNQNPSGTTSNATPSSSININQSGTQTYTTSGGSATLTCTISSYTTNAYNYFRIIINKTWNNNNTLNNNAAGLGEWYINFQAGGQTYSTNYGSTWANQPSLYSQQMLMPGPTISSQLIGISSNTWTQNSISWTASASSNYDAGSIPYKLFNNTINVAGNDVWSSAISYNATTGDYTGSVSTTVSGLGAIAGDWFQLQSSVPLIIQSYSYASFNYNSVGRIIYIVGSNDNSTWYPIHLATMTGANSPFTANGQNMTNTLSITYSGVQTITTSASSGPVTTTSYGTTTINSYTYFRVIGNKSWGKDLLGFLFQYSEFYMNFIGPPSSATITYPSATTTLSESGQYALTASISNPVLLGELNFENTYVDTAPTPTLTYVGNQGHNSGGNISLSTAQAKVGTYSLSSTNDAGSESNLSYANYTLPAFFTSANAYTISAWIYPTAYPSSSNNPASPFALTNGSTLSSSLLYFYPNGTLGLFYYTTPSTSTAVGFISVNSITTNTWSHVAYIFASGMAYLYINGVLSGSNSYTGTICLNGNIGTPTNLSIGCGNSVWGGYRGFVDNLRIYNSALTPQQIQTIYANNVSSTTLTQIVPSFSVSPQQTGLITNTWNQGGVNWTASASSVLTPGTFLAYGAFNNYIGSIQPYSWCSIGGVYAGTPAGTYNGTTITTVLGGVGSVSGEWLQLQSSVPLIIHSYTYASGGAPANNGKTYYIIGSNDNTNWFPIQYASMTTNPSTTQFQQCSTYIIINQSGTQTITGGQVGSGTFTTYPTTTTAYTYFRIIATSIYASSNFELGEFNINFTGPANTSLYNVVSPLTGFSTNTYTSNTIPGVITNSAVSNTGQYMVIIANATSGNNVYYSMNYGATFTGLQLGTQTLTSCAISYDGSYITISSGATVYTLNNNSTGFSVALGNQAGYQNQGQNAIAIGNYAGYQNQTANSIILNATGSAVNAVAPGFYVAPIASYVASSSPYLSVMGYGSTDNQVTHSNGGISMLSNGNVGIGTTNPTTALTITNNSSRNISPNISMYGYSDVAGFGPGINFYAFYNAITPQGRIEVFDAGNYGGNMIFSLKANAGTASGPLVEYMRITEAGRVGIGKTNPSTVLHVSGASNTNLNGQLFISDANYTGNQLRLFSYYGGEQSNSFASFQSMYDSTVSLLKINPAGGIVTIGPAAVNQQTVGTGTTSGIALVVNSGTIHGNGAVNITASNYGTRRDCMSCTATIDTNYIISFHAADGTLRGKIAGINSTSISYDATSDRRLKTNISPITNAVQLLQQLKPVNYTWIQDQTPAFGFIAQDVYKVIPQFRNNVNSYTGCECTGTMNCTCYPDDEPIDSDGKPIYYGLDYGRFTPYLVKAIQEQQQTIQQQSTQITTLESTLTIQQSQIDTLIQRLAAANIA
jgi:hypothetical protein